MSKRTKPDQSHPIQKARHSAASTDLSRRISPAVAPERLPWILNRDAMHEYGINDVDGRWVSCCPAE